MRKMSRIFKAAVFRNYIESFDCLVCLDQGFLFIRGDSIITSHLRGRWVYGFFVILRDGKLGGWVVLD